jgi:regulatory protein
MKGIGQDSAAKALRAYDENRGGGDPDLAAALLLMRRKRIGAFRTSGQSDRTKDMAALARGGFSFDVARKALSLPRDEAEETLSQIRA